MSSKNYKKNRISKAKTSGKRKTRSERDASRRRQNSGIVRKGVRPEIIDKNRTSRILLRYCGDDIEANDDQCEKCG